MTQTASRSLELLSLLQTAHRWSGPQLSNRLGISARTLRRDIETLRELGYRINATGGQFSTYQLGAGNTLPPLILDSEQAVAISLALQTSPVTVLGLRDAADRALSTLAQVMSAPLRAQVDATRVTTIANYWEFPAPPIAANILNAVGDAVRRSHLLRFDILRPDGSRPKPGDVDFVLPLRIEPHHLALWAGRWYLVYFQPAERTWAIHRVDRMHPHSPTGIRFSRRELPSGSVADIVMTSHDRGDLPAAWQCLGAATLQLPAQLVARYAPGGSVIEYLDPAHTRLILGAWSWAGIAGILATFDTDITDVQPADLRAACQVLAQRFSEVNS